MGSSAREKVLISLLDTDHVMKRFQSLACRVGIRRLFSARYVTYVCLRLVYVGDQEKVEKFIKVWVFCYFNAPRLEQKSGFRTWHAVQNSTKE